MKKLSSRAAPFTRIVFSLVAFFLLGCTREADDAKKPLDGKKATGGKLENSEEIPFESIYFGPHGTKPVGGVSKGRKGGLVLLDEAAGKDLEEIIARAEATKPDVFLVHADDIHGAVKATRIWFSKRGKVELPIYADEKKRDAPLWFVGYLGVAPSSQWEIRSAAQSERTIRFTFGGKRKGVRTLFSLTAAEHSANFAAHGTTSSCGTRRLCLSRPQSRQWSRCGIP
jgi:hypothetical protein